MKKLNSIVQTVLALSISLMVLSSCQDEEVSPSPPDVKLPDGEALEARFSDNLKEAMQNFTLDASEGGSVTGDKGTQVYIGADILVTAEGDSVSGTVDIELIEVVDKSSMLLNDKPTMGRNENGDKETLISGGEFYVNAKQDGEQLFLRDGRSFNLTVPTDEGDQEMNLFMNENDDCDEPDCEVVWEEEGDGEKRVEVGDDPEGGMAYYGFVQEFGWTNIDKWYNDPRPKTTLFVDVPEGYDNTNCAIYLSYDGEPTALAKFDIYDEAEALFTEHYGQIPIGMEVHFIMVSVVDDEWNYAIQGATIDEDHIETIDELNPTTEAELIDKINNLP